MIPEEDRGPAWLRDYKITDFSQIAADITAMEAFATKLAADVENNYVPHLPAVTQAMLTRVPPPSSAFLELCDFMAAHQIAQDTTQQNVYNFANGTYHFASAAQKISADYRGTDAFARAQLKDVNDAFGVADPSTSGDSSTGGSGDQ